MPQWILDTLANEVVTAFLGGLITTLVGVFVAWWTLFRKRAELRRGQFHGQLVVQNHELLDDGEGHEVLCFTTERVYPNIKEIFPNTALEKLFLQRAALTTKTNPLIDLSGDGEHAQRTIINQLSASVEGLDGDYVMLVTREVQDEVARKMNRVFLIKLPLLQRFRDWNHAEHFHVENPEHWPRVLNIHYAARRVLDDDGNLREDRKAFYDQIVFGSRQILGSHAVDWKAKGSPET